MGSNILIFKLSEMRKLCELFRGNRQLNWVEILGLHEHLTPFISIMVIDDHDRNRELASAIWIWNQADCELQLGKIVVKDNSIKRQGIGTVMMMMIITIAEFYGMQRITGTVAGEPYLWDWYPKLGFTIYDYNKLIMEFNTN